MVGTLPDTIVWLEVKVAGSLIFISVGVYRDISGEGARLSDQDAARRAEPLMPKIGAGLTHGAPDAPEVRIQKIKSIREALLARKQKLLELNKTNVTGDLTDDKIREMLKQTSTTNIAVGGNPQANPFENLKPGDVYKGWQFKGGDPADKKNWIQLKGGK